MLLMSSVHLKLRDLAASLVPHLMQFAETGRWRQLPDRDVDFDGLDAFVDEGEDTGLTLITNANLEALHIIVDYMSRQWVPPGPVQDAYDQIVKALRYES